MKTKIKNTIQLKNNKKFSTSEYTFEKDSAIYYDQMRRLEEAFFGISNPIIREKIIEIAKISDKI